jgi:hypothetical protein
MLVHTLRCWYWSRRSNLFSRFIWTTAATCLYPCLSSVRGFSFAMASYTTLRDSGTVTVAPKNEGDQSALVVISHGLGDSAEGFVDVAEVGYPTTRFFFLLLLLTEFIFLRLLFFSIFLIICRTLSSSYQLHQLNL